MNKIPSFIIFVTVVAAVYFGIHVFVYKCLTRQLVQDPNWQKALKWIFWVSGLSFFIIQSLNSVFKMRELNFYSGTWLGVIAISFFILLLQWIPSLLFPTYAKRMAIIALIVIGVVSVISLINGNRLPVVRHFTIQMKKLPARLNGFKIVQLSDLHIEAFNNPKRLGKIVDRVNALNPDIVVITGDLIDGNILKEPGLCRQLERMKPPYGKLVITGNHDYYGGIKVFYEVARRTGMKVLKNESVIIAGELQFVGLDDDEGMRGRGGGPDFEKAIKGIDTKKPIILLYHRPLGFDKAVERGVDLQLSGHTHAGQIPPMDIIVWLYYKYPWGLFKRDGSYIFTSSGTDVWRTPMRFLTTNEIDCFTLASGQ